LTEETTRGRVDYAAASFSESIDAKENRGEARGERERDLESLKDVLVFIREVFKLQAGIKRKSRGRRIISSGIKIG
jgi:hypothetical protein